MEWKDIKGFEGIYQCSEDGDIFNVEKKHLIRPYLGKGCYHVSLCINGKRKTFILHRIIYETFVGEIPEGYLVCHLDCNKSNNKLSNLKLYKSIKDRYADVEAKKINNHSNGGKKATYAESIEGEIWTDVIGSDGKYKISNIGRVKNAKTNRLKLPYLKRGYYWIILCSDVNIHSSLHKLIYESFYGKIKEGNEVDHINSNTLDNRLENLREVTKQENRTNPNSINKMLTIRQEVYNKKGGKTGIAVLKIDTNGNILKKYETIKQCANDNNINKSILQCWLKDKPQSKVVNNEYYFITEFDYKIQQQNK
jgi:hypothetical protein